MSVDLERVGGVGVISLNAPPANAYNLEMLQELQSVIQNIRQDRAVTQNLLTDLIIYMKKSEDNHKEVGQVAAKYVETLQRSNEQLVKISALLQKSANKTVGLSADDKKDLYDLIQGETEEQ